MKAAQIMAEPQKRWREGKGDIEISSLRDPPRHWGGLAGALSPSYPLTLHPYPF